MFDQLVSLIEWLAWRLPRTLLSQQAGQVRRMLGSFRGNARVLTLTNLCWTVPVAFSSVYLSLFMAEQGLSKVAIGTLGTVTFAFQVVGALLGGWVAHRLGWKRTLVVFDGILWPAVFLCFIFADGYLPFLAASVLMGIMNMVMPAWTSLFIAGVPRSRRAHVFAFNQMPGLIAGMAMPLSGYFVAQYGISGVARMVYGLGIASVLSGWVMRIRWLREPEAARTRGGRISWGEVAVLFRGHLESLRTVLRRRGMPIFIAIQMVMWGIFTLNGTFMSLYLADQRGLRIEPALLSVLPVFSGAGFLLTTLLIVPFVGGAGLFGFALLGAALMAGYIFLVLVAQPGSLAVVMAGNMMWACGWTLFAPTVAAYWSNMMSDRERPRIISLTSAVIMLAVSPIPTIAGALFELHPRNPLLMLLGLLAAGAACLLFVALRRPGTGAPARQP